MSGLDGKVALVTGAGGGIGRATVERLVAAGAAVVAADVAAPEDLAERLGDRVAAVAADVRSGPELRAAVELATERFGGLDVVSANAGVFTAIGRTWEVPDEDFEHVLDVNLTGAFRTAKAAIPAMLAGGRGGSIVITSSVAARVGVRRTAAYAVSKHGLGGLVKVLANELGEHGIRVNSVHPTMVATEMVHSDEMLRRLVPGKADPTLEDLEKLQRRSHVLPVSWTEAQDVAEAIHFLVSDAARHLTGVELPVDAGYLVKT